MVGTLVEVGKKYNERFGQVAPHFLEQNGIVVLVKSANPEHMKENLDIFNFALLEKERKFLQI